MFIKPTNENQISNKQVHADLIYIEPATDANLSLNQLADKDPISNNPVDKNLIPNDPINKDKILLVPTIDDYPNPRTYSSILSEAELLDDEFPSSIDKQQSGLLIGILNNLVETCSEQGKAMKKCDPFQPDLRVKKFQPTKFPKSWYNG